MKTLLSSRYLELLSGKLIALLFDLFFQLIQILRLSFNNCILQKCPQVDLLEDNRILSQIFRYEFITSFSFIFCRRRLGSCTLPLSSIFASGIFLLTHFTHYYHK